MLQKETRLRMLELAEALQQIESTSRHREMASILARLFQAAKGEADKIAYVLHGRLGPPFEAPEFGVDERLVIAALTHAANVPEAEAIRSFKRAGDLGLAAEKLLPAKPSGGLAFGDVFVALQQIAAAAGAKSQERKVATVADLIARANGLEARYILRFLLGRLRLGIGDATMMDALSIASVGDTLLRPAIERAYTLCSDLGLVAGMLLEHGPAAIEAIRPQVGKPIMVELAERLPSPTEVVRKLGTVQAEPKYDGLRLQIHKDGERVHFFTRRLENVTGMFPDLAKGALQIKAKTAILDGEAVVYNPKTGQYLPFQVTVRRKRKYKVEQMETQYPLRYFAFDLIYVDGHDLTELPLTERRRRLEHILAGAEGNALQLTDYIITDQPSDLERLFQEKTRRGLEGLVVKRPNAPYMAGKRSFSWVKLKRSYRTELRDTVDVVVVGYLAGKGKRAAFGIGSLLGAVYEPASGQFRTVSKIGSGLTDEEWREMKLALDRAEAVTKPTSVDSLIAPDVWVEPRHVVEVQADEITRSPRHTCGKTGKESGYALRFPRVVALRWDRRPEDATTEQEILAMYRQQQARGEPASA